MVLTRSARRSISSNTLLESQEFKAGISDKENFSPDVVKKTAPSSARKSSGRRKALQMKTLNRSKSVRSLGMTPEPKKLRRKASARKVPASASKTSHRTYTQFASRKMSKNATEDVKSSLRRRSRASTRNSGDSPNKATCFPMKVPTAAASLAKQNLSKPVNNVKARQDMKPKSDVNNLPKDPEQKETEIKGRKLFMQFLACLAVVMIMSLVFFQSDVENLWVRTMEFIGFESGCDGEDEVQPIIVTFQRPPKASF